jgi:hypothetical protein
LILQIVGRCTYQQLPEKYRTLFGSGANHVQDGKFVAQKYPWAEFISIGVGLFFAMAPILFVCDLGIELLSAVGLLSLIPPTGIGLLAIRTVQGYGEVRRRRREGDHVVGLVFDDENLVLHTLNAFSRKNCVFLPHANVAGVRVAHEFDEVRGGRQRAPVLRLSFTDQRGKTRMIDVKENEFELAPRDLEGLFLARNKGLRGEWSLMQPVLAEPESDTLVRFDEQEGAIIWVTDGQRETAPFKNRTDADNTLQIEQIAGNRESRIHIEAGRYPFEITVGYERQGRFYVLKFANGFAGWTGLSRLGQKI